MMRLSTAVMLAAVVWSSVGCGPSRNPAAPSPAPPLLPQAPPNGLPIRGVVQDRASRPLTGALVEVLDGPQSGRSTLTNAAGEYSFSGLFLRTETFRASHEGYVPESRTYQSGISFYLTSLAPSVDISGDYTLMMVADPSCTNLPEPMRSRTYTVKIDGYGMVSGATFFGGYSEFGTYIAGDFVRLEFDLDGSPWLIEQPGPTTYLGFRGAASAPVAVPITTIAAPFEGVFDYCALKSPMGTSSFNCNAGPGDVHVACSSTHHQLSLTRR
ncbi:MAG TPA: carboxypeptidase-like regulatory domain-containing protein [Vicinamibacterales bacterium]|jgi:hypothetical protein|nr:carboxypeptidase-like regulatory domain-containing protein [Vicinamibacterales bacterium]